MLLVQGSWSAWNRNDETPSRRLLSLAELSRQGVATMMKSRMKTPCARVDIHDDTEYSARKKWNLKIHPRQHQYSWWYLLSRS